MSVGYYSDSWHALRGPECDAAGEGGRGAGASEYDVFAKRVNRRYGWCCCCRGLDLVVVVVVVVVVVRPSLSR
jgi:hypothetical protein